MMGGKSLSQEVTPEVTPIAKLTSRNPTIQELEGYLFYYLPASTQDYINEYGKSYFFRWEDDAPTIYKDVNGDAENDLIVEGYQYVAVMVWLGNEYSEPLQVHTRSGARDSWSEVSFEDWTDDGIPEIVFNHKIAISGTGIGGNVWHRTIIHCFETSCANVWEGEIAQYYYVTSYTDGLSLRRTLISDLPQGENKIGFEILSTDFAFACTYSCALVVDLPLPEGSPVQQEPFRTGGTTLSRYEWNGSRFHLVHEEILEEASLMEIASQIEATSELGVASIQLNFVTPEYAYVETQQCQIVVDDNLLGDPFFCLFPFVSWQDVIGDEQLELVVSAYGGRNYTVEEGEYDCGHQRMIVFELQGDDFAEIANVTGCISQPDLFGVRLEDIDDDPALEIISAGNIYNLAEFDSCDFGYCLYELSQTDEIYDWDGNAFSLSGTMPRDENTMLSGLSD